MFKNIQIRGWRQFQDISLEFHDRLTILTGANASGKTTILKILAQHFGWQLQFISTKAKKGKILRAIADFWGKDDLHNDNQSNQNIIGHITYDNETTSDIIVPSKNSPTYNINIRNLQPVSGLFIPSHRPIPVYQEVQDIPTKVQTKDQAFNNYKNEILNRYRSGRGSNQPPSFRIKQTLISLATFGYGNQAVERNQEAIDTFEGFQEILRKVLPPKIGFQRLTVSLPDVMIETNSGNFPIDSMSGGMASIFDIAWQIYMYSPEGESYVVTIDEPENHLHPELQRSLLTDFLKAFPNVQFIVSTHNPFIVGSVPDSNVYVLDYNHNDKVESIYLDTANRAGTSNEILRGVLGLSDTLPIWVKSQMDRIISDYSKKELNEETLASLRDELKSQGLDNIITDVIAEVFNQNKD